MTTQGHAVGLTELAGRVEKLTGPCRETDADIGIAVGLFTEKHGLPGGGWVSRDEHSAVIAAPNYTGSLDAIRSIGGMVVFASDIGADGLAMAKIVIDTSISPIVEYTGIAAQLQHAWLAAALRARAALESSHG